MLKDFLNDADCKDLTDIDFNNFGRFIYLYEQHIVKNFGMFNWNDENFNQFCKNNKIQQKGNKTILKQHNHFWFSANKTKDKHSNDVAHHFLRHIRNAYAHGNIKVVKEGKTKSKYYLIQDFDVKKNKSSEQTMQGKIRDVLLWEMINILYNTIKTTQK